MSLQKNTTVPANSPGSTRGLTAEERSSLERLRKVAELIAAGDYREVDNLMAMTAGQDLPRSITALAEAFGMMVVKVESREWHLELLVKQLLNANLEMLEMLGAMIAKRDSDTSAHNYRVTLYAVRLAERLGLGLPDIRALVKGAFLHDIGKIAIPDNILLKPGRLDEQEFGVMRTHVDHGVEIIRGSSWLKDAEAVVRCHHEKYNGEGYPNGLSGEAIPLVARIFAIVDVFDALTSRRPYKEAMTVEQALAIITESAGSHFDPRLVDIFLPLAATWHEELSQLDEKAVAERMRQLVALYFDDFKSLSDHRV
ncbi:HD-GYP domain-containing protein [Thiorhodovibrio frisius]|uniref:Putative domain HDIG-containing protein n=1 Tax=Thiorhodovibrio frisius TaxID=631362 RepID=H8Z1P1_9GAMM|nr:HD-GYP domain-containing protein [Thiorhodovibrio frisius]EIC21486.1 putative domain HDIG-containing protein [Thiorhodovibrio frisius]WPL24072.1 Cyclic di-GMP phosphodiesterase response regulator RpfG [Thiorhodovibrio frisius]